MFIHMATSAREAQYCSRPLVRRQEDGLSLGNICYRATVTSQALWVMYRVFAALHELVCRWRARRLHMNVLNNYKSCCFYLKSVFSLSLTRWWWKLPTSSSGAIKSFAEGHFPEKPEIKLMSPDCWYQTDGLWGRQSIFWAVDIIRSQWINQPLLLPHYMCPGFSGCSSNINVERVRSSSLLIWQINEGLAGEWPAAFTSIINEIIIILLFTLPSPHFADS